MLSGKKITAAIVLTFFLIGLAWFFYPKEMKYGFRGQATIQNNYTNAEYSCLGFSAQENCNTPDYGCSYKCYGLLGERKCTMTFYDGKGLQDEAISCDRVQPPYWIPGRQS